MASANLTPETAAPAVLRRRITPLGQEALRMAWRVPESAEARLILSSRHGEFSRTVSILETLAAGDAVSPADFALSVHHALAGVLSMARSNRKGHIAVSAGTESFCYALIEAAACLSDKPDEPVVILHYDEPLPEPFAPFDDDTVPSALVLVLTAEGEGVPISITASPATHSGTLSASHAEDFVGFLENGGLGELVSTGARLAWRWQRHAQAA